MIALLDDLAVCQQDNIIGMLDGGQAVGNDQHGADVLHLFQRVLNEKLSLGVDVGGGLVQDHHRRTVDDGPGETQQLPLTGGEVVAPLPDDLVQSLLLTGDEGIGVDVLAGLPDLVIGEAVLPEDDVASNRAGEKEHILEHLAEVTAQGCNGDPADVDAIDQNLALLDVVVADDEAQDGGLAGAGGADEGHGLLGVDVEGHALQDPLAGLVGKPDVLELDLAPDLLQLDDVFLVLQVGGHIHDGEDLLRRGEGLLEHVKLLRQLLDGVEELGDIHVEGDNDGAVDGLAQECPVLDVALARHIQQAQHRCDVEHVDHGAENAEDVHAVALGLGQAVAAGEEILVLFVLPVEDLGDLHAGEVLGQVGIQVRGGIVDGAVDHSGEPAEDHRKDHQEGHEAQHHQGQGVVQHQHGAQHADDHHGIFAQGHQNVGEHVGDAVGIVGDTGHQLAHRDVVELLVGELLDVGEDVLADLRQDLLAHPLEDHGLDVGAYDADDEDACVGGHHGQQGVDLKVRLDHVLDLADEPGGDDVVGDGQEHDEEDNDKVLPEGLGIGQQAADDLGVGHVALEAHGGLLVLDGSIGDDERQGEGADDAAGDEQGKIFSHITCPPLPVSAGPPSCGRLRCWRTGYRGYPCRRGGRPR